MESPAGYRLRIVRTNPSSAMNHFMTYIVIRPAYAHLEEELRRIGNVKVIVDRRSHARRDLHDPVAAERRRADRRRETEELGELVVVNHDV